MFDFRHRSGEPNPVLGVRKTNRCFSLALCFTRKISPPFSKPTSEIWHNLSSHQKRKTKLNLRFRYNLHHHIQLAMTNTLSQMRNSLRNIAKEDLLRQPTDSQHCDSDSESSDRVSRGVHRSRSCIVDMRIDGKTKRRRGSLTFATSVNDLPRAGASRAVQGDCPPRRPRRASLC